MESKVETAYIYINTHTHNNQNFVLLSNDVSNIFYKHKYNCLYNIPVYIVRL